MISLDGEFQLAFFMENDFIRKKCEVCGVHYWTQDQQSRNCGDSPCQEYAFIGKSPTKRGFTLSQLRELFLKYFEKNNHTIIKPYPVIARWRDDVYLVGASIYDFQPYVTEGRMPPPANPLVVSQPCIRFTDIDKVGQTFGRHMTIFEMGGAHAFNSKEKEIYWKDDTVRFHHEFLKNELGVKSEEVRYKEDFWSGGGNAGPDVEACVSGLEISTLVFMMYKYIGEELVEMPLKTVDTGYGMERWSWLSQGSPTGFHATYGALLDETADLAGLKINNRIVMEVARASSTTAYKSPSDWLTTRTAIAKNYGLTIEGLDNVLSGLQSVCAVLDHIKALSFLLSEGVVPSNMQEGYLARLLIRRAYRMLRSLGIEGKFLEIVEKEIALWSADFPNLKAMKDEIIEELTVEQEKYCRTLDKGAELVKRISQQTKKSGLRTIPQETLIELYDSHGIVPEMVKEFTEDQQTEVIIPEDFFGKVAQRHLETKPPEESSTIKSLKEKVAKHPATKKLYYEDPYLKEFKAKVLDVIDGKYVILDQTCFYSEGGGQISDVGTLNVNGKTAKVIDVQSVGDVTVHSIEGNIPTLDTEITGVIDWERRLSLMRHHTSTHVLIGAVRRILGEHAWQAGAAKDVQISRLDISHYKHLSSEEINRIEQLACKAVTMNLPVETRWTPRDEAERTYGYRLYQGGAVPGVVIRLVKVGDWDVEACGGTHVRSTGEIGVIKILRTERIQDGVERLIFASGPHALEQIQRKESLLQETSKILNTLAENLPRTAFTLSNERDKLTKKITLLRDQFTDEEAKTLLKKIKKVGRVKFLIHEIKDYEEDEVIMLGSKLTEAEPAIVAVLLLMQKTIRIFCFAGKKAIKAGADAGKLADELAGAAGGGGGGRDYFGQGGGAEISKLKTITSSASKRLAKQLRKR